MRVIKTHMQIKEVLFACILSILEVQLFEHLNWLKKVIAFIPEAYIKLLENFLDISVLIGINITLLHLITIGFRKLCNKVDIIAKISNAVINSKWTKIMCILFLVGISAFAVTKIFYKSYDKTIPTVTATMSDNNVVKTQQYEVPLIYYVCFEDETDIQKVYFDESYIELNDCTANIAITKSKSKNGFVISLTNIQGESGKHYLTIKEGAALDISGNESASTQLDSFYLYTNANDIDTEAPQLDFERLQSVNSKQLVFEVSITDNIALSSIYLTEKHLILQGLKADVEVQSIKADVKRIILNNVEYQETQESNIIIFPGVATDEWGNSSSTYIYRVSKN